VKKTQDCRWWSFFTTKLHKDPFTIMSKALRFFKKTPQKPVLSEAEYAKQGRTLAGIGKKVDAVHTDLKELADTMNTVSKEKDTELKSMALKLRESQQREAESVRKLDASERKAEQLERKAARSEAAAHYFFDQINGRQLFPAAPVTATDVKLVEPMLHVNHSVVLPIADPPVPTVLLPAAVSEPVTTGVSPVPGRVPAAGNDLNNVPGNDGPPPEEIARAQAQDVIAPSSIGNDHTGPTVVPVTAMPGTMLTISPPPGDSKRRPRRQLLFNALNLKSVKLKKTPKKKSVNNSNQNPRVKELLARCKSVALESDSDNSDNSGWESEESSPVVFARRPRVPTPSSRRAPMSLLAMINSRKSGLRSNSNNVNICKK
jgi:hypothetical protein